MKGKLLILLLFISCNLFAQTTVNYDDPKEYILGGVSISGIKFLNHNALIQLSGLSIGQKIKIPGEDVTHAIEKLWRQGLFSDVKIRIVKIEGKNVFLDIYLQERPKLSKVYFKGIRKSEKDDLRDKTSLIAGTKVTKHVIMKAKNVIKNYYAEKGFYNTDVIIIQKADTLLQNVVNLHINIDKREKVKIKEIIIEGNTAFSDKKVKRYLKETKIKRWYGLFKPSKYIEDKFKEDKKNLITKYNKFGYRNARILDDSVYLVDNNTMLNLYLKVHEGKQFYFRNITWVGNTKYSTRLLSKALDINKGDLYDQNKLDERLTTAQDAVSNIYLDDGYLFFRAIPKEVLIENDSIDIEIMIVEGPQATIDRVIISGNTRTNDHVIRRETRYTPPGQLFSKSGIIRVVRELAQLGNFDAEKLAPNPVPDPMAGTVNIQYPVIERSSDMFELSGGWGANMFVGRVGLKFNNFSTKNIFDKQAWQPLPVGDGQQLSISIQSNGKYYQYYNVSFVEPWLGGKKPNSLSLSLYMNKGRTYYSVGEYKVYGASLGLGRRLKWPDDYFQLYNEFSYQYYQNYAGILAGTNNITFKTVFSRNSVDYPIYPRRGSNYSITMQLTPPYSAINDNILEDLEKNKYRWMEYHKWLFKAQNFYPIYKDFVLHTKIEYGFVGYYNREIGYPPLEGFSVGGDGMGYYTFGKDIIGLRGYENGTLTPKDANGQDNGNLYSKYTFELRYPLTLSESAQIYAMTFIEAGNAWSNLEQFNPFKMYRSAGIGVRVFLPMLGMLGIDWGYGFDPLSGSSTPSGGQFHFTMGQQF